MTRTTPNAVQNVRSGSVKRPWLDYILLAAPCFSTPMLLWAENYVGVGHPGRLVAIGAVAWIVSAAFLAIVRSLRVPRPVSLVGVWGFSYVFMRGAALIHALGYLSAILATTTVILIVGYLLSRRPNSSLRVVVVLASAVLVAEVALAWYSNAIFLGGDHTLPAPQDVDVTLKRTPDIVLIVADAYIGLEGLGRYFDVSVPEWRNRLSQLGFTVPDVAYSPYPSTSAAIPAILDMTYPLEAGPGVSKATSRTLYERIGGENRVVRSLVSNGYQTTMIESGWSGSACGERIDTCLPSPFLNESTFFTLNKTWAGPWVLEKYGYSFTVGALNTMSWLRENLSDITHDSKPDLIIAHVGIPHPPFFLDSECNLNTGRARSGTTLQWPGVDLDFRKEAYLEQAACVDGFVQSVAKDVSDNTVILILGDHGPDSYHQLVMHPDDWSEDATRERLNVMFAYKGLHGCQVEEPVLLTEVFRDVLECLGESSIEPLEPRMFRYAGVSFDGRPSPIVELSPEEVNKLLGQ